MGYAKTLYVGRGEEGEGGGRGEEGEGRRERGRGRRERGGGRGWRIDEWEGEGRITASLCMLSMPLSKLSHGICGLAASISPLNHVLLPKQIMLQCIPYPHIHSPHPPTHPFTPPSHTPTPTLPHTYPTLPHTYPHPPTQGGEEAYRCYVKKAVPSLTHLDDVSMTTGDALRSKSSLFSLTSAGMDSRDWHAVQGAIKCTPFRDDQRNTSPHEDTPSSPG